ncbi:hypothetical protein [Formosa maritima]|uniref:Uncharacterized protein n=1 Tax=Formosa maritima TaxID=2592046 RepID=A0A5D0GEC3_9FLAO|nr:hypothetical protein [Formosa maritima]TYA57328.1 hypothetical protein FVF61_05335 [Formosa maritima]
MNSTVKNILAIVAGLVAGSIVNMALITISGSVIPLPEGVDNTTTEGLKESMHLFQPRHFIFPFLAHAMGTFVGALIAAKIAATSKMTFAMAIGVLFLIGGIASVIMLPAPTWFSILDIVGAYIPMAYIGGKLAIMYK